MKVEKLNRNKGTQTFFLLYLIDSFLIESQ